MKRLLFMLLVSLSVPVLTHAYTPNDRDTTVMERISERINVVEELGSKEHLVALFSRVLEVSEDVSQNAQGLYLLEFTLQTIANVLDAEYDVEVTWDALYDEEIALILTNTSRDADDEEREDVPVVTSLVGADEMTSYSLSGFYEAYKGYVSSETPISDLCIEWFDEIDAVAKEYDFPTALIIATWFKEHTCKFNNPANGRGNFQITSHYYYPGEITWEKFENQIVNFIIFSRAKWDYYDDVQTYGEDPIRLTYDTLDLASLRKHAIFYNGVRGDLDTNLYANQNFGMPADGRDGIVAMTLRVLGWQLYQEKDIGPMFASMQDTEIEDLEEEVEELEEEVEDLEEELEEDEGSDTVDEDCEDPFTVDLGPDANHPEVLAMQEFLADQGFYVGDPSGVYDSKTTEAVNAFQAYYKSDILDPGGYTAPTGYWYPATRRKANSIVCPQ